MPFILRPRPAPDRTSYRSRLQERLRRTIEDEAWNETRAQTALHAMHLNETRTGVPAFVTEHAAVVMDATFGALGGEYRFEDEGIAAAIARIEADNARVTVGLRDSKPALYAVPVDPVTEAARAMRTARAAYDARYPEGA